MVEMEERELLLASLKGYLEELQDSGVDELVFAKDAPAAVAADRCAAAPCQPAAMAEAGNPRARLLFAGCDVSFSGPSGELLVKIVQAMGFSAEQVLLLSFSQTQSGEPAPLRESLLSRMGEVAPQVAVMLGEQAAQLLLGSRDSISQLRGRFVDVQGITVLATLHPDQLLADPALKREVWNEMQQVMARLKAV
jgi:uracil-DNA glycosylase family 4